MTTEELFDLLIGLFPQSAVVKHVNSVDVIIGDGEALIVDLRPQQGSQTKAEIVCGLNDNTVLSRDVPKTAEDIERRISIARRALAMMETTS